MDPITAIGVLSSIISVAQLAAQAIQYTYSYQQTARSASTEIIAIRDELLDLQVVLRNIQRVLDNPAGSSDPNLSLILRICGGTPTISQLISQSTDSLPSSPPLSDEKSDPSDFSPTPTLIGSPPVSPSIPCEVLHRSQTTLHHLIDRLRPPTGRAAKLKQALRWPLDKDETNRNIEYLQRVKSTLQLAMTGHQTDVLLSLQTEFSLFSKMMISTEQHDNAVLDAVGSLKSEVLNLGKRADLVKDEALRGKVVEWLKPSDPATSYNRHIKGRHQDTCRWFIDGEDFEYWKRADDTFSLLCLYGGMGMGKSVLCSSVVEDLHGHCSESSPSALAYFYFDFNDSQKQTLEDLLKSLSSQLGEKDSTAFKILSRFYKDHRDGRQKPTTEELSQMLVDIIATLDEVYVVIDALDESSERPELMSWIEGIGNAQLENLSILTTSRPEMDIKVTLEALPGYIPVLFQKSTVDADIRSHVQSQLKTHPRLSKWSPDIKHKIATYLLAGADGMFRWTQCQLDVLCTLKTNRQVLQALQNLPKGLFETYDRILLAIPSEDFDLARRALSFLVSSFRPMKSKELIEVLAVDLEDLKDLDIDSRLNDEQDLFAICGSLVEFGTEDQIRLAHQSVREYLISGHLEKHLTLSPFSLSESQAHRDSAEVTLVYVLSSYFRSGPCATPSLRDERLKDYPLLRYISEYWSRHVEESRGSDQVSQLVVDLIFGDEYEPNFWALLDLTYLSRWGKAFPRCKLLTEHRFTWVIERLEDRSWFNDELAAHGTPLTNAVKRNDYEMTRFLLDAGVDIDKRAASHVHEPGVFPLWTATSSYSPSSSEIFDLLLERGANVHQLSRYLEAPIHNASFRGSLPMIKNLILHGSDVNQPSRDGRTPLTFAAMACSLDAVKYLVEAGATLGNGKTALQYAIERQDAEIADYLLGIFEGSETSCELTQAQVEWLSRLPRLVNQPERVAALSTSSNMSPDEWGMIQTMCILQLRLRLPRAVALNILDQGHIWMYRRASRDSRITITSGHPLEAYLTLTVLRSSVRKILFRTTSHDQGWSDFHDLHGTYRDSHSWFEVGAQSSDGISTPRHYLQNNVHASRTSRTHTNVWDIQNSAAQIRDWLRCLQQGDTVQLFPRARFPGWSNTVDSAEIEIACAWR